MLSLANLIAAAVSAPGPGDLLLGPDHRRPLQGAILTHLAGCEGASSYAIAAAVNKLRQTVDNCMTEALMPRGLVTRAKRRQCIADKVFDAWYYQLAPAARERLAAASDNRGDAS